MAEELFYKNCEEKKLWKIWTIFKGNPQKYSIKKSF